MVKAVKDSVVLDNWGIGVSILCSIHCALMPILIVTSAIVGWQAETLEEIELPLFIVAAIIGSVSILNVYFQKRRTKPVYFLLAGLALILVGGFVESEWLEPAFRGLGSLFIVAAHVVNKRTLKNA